MPGMQMANQSQNNMTATQKVAQIVEEVTNSDSFKDAQKTKALEE
jgi:hypothetical protein